MHTFNIYTVETFLMVQCLRLHASTAGFDLWSENQDPTCHVVQKKKKKKYAQHLNNECLLISPRHIFM